MTLETLEIIGSFMQTFGKLKGTFFLGFLVVLNGLLASFDKQCSLYSHIPI